MSRPKCMPMIFSFETQKTFIPKKNKGSIATVVNKYSGVSRVTLVFPQNWTWALWQQARDPALLCLSMIFHPWTVSKGNARDKINWTSRHSIITGTGGMIACAVGYQDLKYVSIRWKIWARIWSRWQQYKFKQKIILNGFFVVCLLFALLSKHLPITWNKI